MTYRVSFTVTDPKAIESLRAMNGSRIDGLTIDEVTATPSVLAPGKTQTDRLFNVLSDGYPHRTDEILRKVYGSDHLGIARIGARVADLKQKGYVIPDAKPDPNKPTLYWYRMERIKSIQPTS